MSMVGTARPLLRPAAFLFLLVFHLLIPSAYSRLSLLFSAPLFWSDRSNFFVLPHGFPIFSASVSTFPVHREFDLHAAGDKRDTSSRRVLADFLMPDSRCDAITDNRLIRSCEMVSGSSLIRKRCFWHFLIRRILR